MKSQKRIRQKHIKVFVTDQEKIDVEINAANTTGTASSYLRQLGLGYIPPSKLDHQAVLTLAKVNGDLGRLGGLLKMWLTSDERLTAFDEKEIPKILANICGLQKQLKEEVERL